MSATPQNVIAQLVETMRALAGPHPGFRPVHAKGLVCSGTFQATPEARGVSRATHLQGQPIPTVIRFSNASGDPNIHDGTASPRAMAVKFQLPDRKNADILALSIEGFPARTPEEFLELLRAQLPSAGADALPHFLASHPATGAFLGRVGQKPVPSSYGQASYHGEHAFLFTAADGASRFGRYHWIPEAGEAYLAPDNASKLDPNFLRAELDQRTKKGPVALRLQLQLAEKGDPTNDATALWPANRARIELGRLEITAVSPTSAADERRMVFDPSNVIDGIAVSDDPILLARSSAYSISYDERSKA